MKVTHRMRQLEALIRGYWPRRHGALPMGGLRVWIAALRGARECFRVEFNALLKRHYGPLL